MTAKIIDCKAYAKQKLAETRKILYERGCRPPELAIIATSNDPASDVYIRNKVKTASDYDISAHVYRFNEDAPLGNIVGMIEVLNRSQFVDGIIVQLPLNPDLARNERYILDKIDPKKDVDGLTSASIAALDTGEDLFGPCTPVGIMHMLDDFKIPVSKKHAVIVGRSNLVGKPLAKILLNRDATVTVCHSYTQNLAEITRQADILISAAGQPKLITADMVKEGAVVIDVGINRDENGKLCGDVDFEAVKEKASWITPVPGGIGPITVMTLMRHTIIAQFERNRR